ALRDLIGEVQRGRLSRRRFVQAMFGLGLSAPIAGHLLAAAGLAQTRPAGPAPARRGGGGPLRLLYWQAPTILNPHLSVGVKVVFKQPTPFWSEPFCGGGGLVIPKHVFSAYRGARSREAPANLKPVGTGPYRYVDFRAGDTVRAEMNPAYHVANRPSFDTLEM